MSMMSGQSFTADDFRLLPKDGGLAAFEGEPIAYWKTVWLKLKKNPRAMFSLVLVVFLVLFSCLGPLIWRVDPSQQDLSQLSQAPALVKEAFVFENNSDWLKEKQQRLALMEKSTSLNPELLGKAHTQAVRFFWNPVKGAALYQIYRHEYKPLGLHDPGLPLTDIDANGETFYEDKLALETIDYFYMLIARDGEGKVLTHGVLPVRPVLAIPASKVNEKVGKGEWRLLEQKEGGFNKVRLPAHPMGTDYLGRDMMSRLMYGGRTSLLIALFASLAFIFAGSIYGAISGYSGGRVDNLMMRLADFVIALPFLLFMILLKVSFSVGPGESGISVMIFSLILLSWPASARLVRGQVLALREQNFILAARINGARLSYMISRHLFPNVLSVILISLSFAIPSVILTEAFLSFIGLGVVPPTPSWGSMCQEGIKTFLFHPHELIFPSFFIGATVLAFNLLGDGLRDALDSRVD